jgi:hypothetical protein
VPWSAPARRRTRWQRIGSTRQKGPAGVQYDQSRANLEHMFRPTAKILDTSQSCHVCANISQRQAHARKTCTNRRQNLRPKMSAGHEPRRRMKMYAPV